MESQSFKVRGLDCAEEVAILKRVVGPLVSDENALAFDLMNGKLIVHRSQETLPETDILSAIAKTGMKAVPWEQHVAAAQSGSEPFWTTHGRAVLCAVSGVCVVLATAAHGLTHSWADAFGGHGEEHSYPVYVIALYIAALVTGAWYIVPKAIYSARSLRPDMNLLMVVAEVGAVGLGEWMEAAMVAFLFSVALLLETWSVGRARRAIESLMDLSPDMARVRCATHGIDEKPVGDVGVNATVLVRPGEKIPLDGTITEGATSINEASITGESIPVTKDVGDSVFAGTLNTTGAFEFCVSCAADDTTLARIIRLVEEAQSRRAPSEQWVEKFARFYTPAMMAIALAIALIPPLALGGAWDTWFYQALVILVIACPCALVISTPVSIVSGLARAAREGVLIKGGVYLEAPAHLRAVAFDKTGTITHGTPEVQEIVPLNGHDSDELLERAAAMEAHSEHPLATAILRKAEADRVEFAPATGFTSVLGKGAEGEYRGKSFWIGSHRMLHEKGGETPACHDSAVALEDRGHSVIAIGNDDHVCGLISVADEIREDSRPAIAALHETGIERVVMLTGDNEATARNVAAEVGVDEFRAELLPEEKVNAVQELVKQYGHVAMIGDGVNDAPAMAAASLGVAMGVAGSDAAIETADIALMSDDLSKLAWLMRHSRRTLRVIRQNIAFALGLKLAFILLAMAGVATLWMAIAADMGASLLVIFNGLRLLR